MGWISKRAFETGGSINKNPRNNGSDKGPLRRIVRRMRIAQTLFDHDWVEFECGHEGPAVGMVRGRCRQCKESTQSTKGV